MSARRDAISRQLSLDNPDHYVSGIGGAAVRCGACGSDNSDGNRFCGHCAAALALRCPSCGAEVGGEQRFCGQCAAPLAVTSTAPATIPTQPGPSQSENRQVSVLFVDLVGFTTLSESRDPEDVRELLSKYFDTTRTIIARYGGVVEKFIGDAVMAVWGAPTAREDDAERAVRAALDVVESVATFGAEIDVPLAARGGVVTGGGAAWTAPGEGPGAGGRGHHAAPGGAGGPAGGVFLPAGDPPRAAGPH